MTGLGNYSPRNPKKQDSKISLGGQTGEQTSRSSANRRPALPAGCGFS